MVVPQDAQSKRVTGSDSGFQFIFPWKTPNLKEATDRAIENAGPGYDCLIDGVVTYKWKWYVFFSKPTFEVEGTAIKSNKINNN